MSDLTRLPVPGRLEDLEEVIERGMATFVEVGEALLEIRDQRLYRVNHGTWEAYLSARWQMSPSRAHRLIDGAEVSRMLPIGNVPNEAVARELVPVMRQDPVSLPVVMAAAQERAGDRPVTAADVRAEVRERFRTMAAESEAEMREATAAWTPEQRAAVAPEVMRQRGELARLIHDMNMLPDAAALARAHGDALSSGSNFFAEAMFACGWLESFCNELEASKRARRGA